MNQTTGLLAALAVIAILGFAIWRGRKRRKEIAQWAASEGLLFSAGRDRSLEGRFPSYGCLRRGHSRYAYNICWGEWSGHAVWAFDYHYATGSGKSRHDYHFSGIVLSSDVPLKPLHIRPEGLFDKLTEFFGLDDIDFESAEFSRAFHVKAPDKRWAYDVLHQRSMELLLGMPRMSIQFAENSLMVWKGRRFAPETFKQALEIAGGLLDGLPTYVVDQQKGKGRS